MLVIKQDFLNHLKADSLSLSLLAPRSLRRSVAANSGFAQVFSAEALAHAALCLGHRTPHVLRA